MIQSFIAASGLRIRIVAVVVISLSAIAQAQIQTRAAEIRAAMDARDFLRAETLARELRASDPTAFAANNYDYLLARLCHRRGERAEAASLYLALVNRNSALAAYALFHLAAIARDTGDFASERQYFTRLAASYPSSALLTDSRERIIDSFRESRDYRSLIAMLRPLAATNNPRGRRYGVRLAEAYSKTGDVQSARSLFEQLTSGSRDDYALAAAEGLDSLDRETNTKPNEFEALRRARIYLHNRHWSEARAHFLDIVERFPESPNRPEAIYQTGFTFYREENHDEAIRWFEQVYSQFPSKKEGEQGYYWVATALQRARRYKEAARRYIDFISVFPQSELIEGAYRNTVDCFRYAGQMEEAIEWSRRITQVFVRKPLATVGLFNEAKIELARGNYASAIELFTRLQAQAVYPRLVSAPTRGEAAFLRIYSIEQAGRTAEAARLYLALPDERDNYFGYRATERLRAIAKTKEGRAIIASLARSYAEQARAALKASRYSEAKGAANQALRLTEDQKTQGDLIRILQACYSQLPAYSSVWRFRLISAARDAITDGKPSTDASNRGLAAELLFLGLYDEGARELRLGGIADEENGSRDAQYSLAVYSNRGERSNYAIEFAESFFKTVPQDYRIELMPRDLAEMMYPAPYRDALARYAAPRGVDPRLILAIARQESRFDPRVKSAAAARGLLQFISETAIKTARDEGITDFELDDVYEPRVAVRLAARLVADLFKLFPDNEYAVIASYNTGEINVERWLARAGSSDVDRLVAEMALPETKDYLAKVINNYRAYQRLYS
ncbi:MAG: transglycosylase SLT domain-containing protein, partial [Acidobacteriota bacterium]